MLQLKSISFHADSTDGKTEIIRNISLNLDKNKFIVITGPNGGGKSTLAKMIAGIVSCNGRFYCLSGRGDLRSFDHRPRKAWHRLCISTACSL